MDGRARDLISRLQLSPHPEGGYFREAYRSSSRVQPSGTTADRAALTTIYFLLPAGAVSHWHRVASDEVWHHYEGAPLRLLTADSAFEHLTQRVLGPVGGDAVPVHVVAAGQWQAAQSAGQYTLVGCTVGPGFEYADFEIFDVRHGTAAAISKRHPIAAPFFAAPGI